VAIGPSSRRVQEQRPAATGSDTQLDVSWWWDIDIELLGPCTEQYLVKGVMAMPCTAQHLGRTLLQACIRKEIENTSLAYIYHTP